MEVTSAVQPASSDAAASMEKKKKKYKFKPGTVSIREIRKLQKTTKHLIQRKPFYRLVKEISAAIDSNCKFQQEAVNALQDDAESYLISYFQRSQKNAIHAGRKTVHFEDTQVST